MNSNEFQRWCDQLLIKLPDTGYWLQKQSQDTIDFWESILANQDYNDCAAAIDHLVRDGFNSFQREQLIAAVSKFAADLRYERDRVQEQARHRLADRKRRQRGKSFAGGLSETMIAAGVSEQFLKLIEEQDRRRRNSLPPLRGEEREAFVESLFEGVPDAESEPRYRCLDCCDSGFVQRRAKDGRTWSAACHCEAGEKNKQNWRNRFGRSLKQIDPSPKFRF
jgi:hypothetical protein